MEQYPYQKDLRQLLKVIIIILLVLGGLILYLWISSILNNYDVLKNDQPAPTTPISGNLTGGNQKPINSTIENTPTYKGKVIAGTSSLLLDFNQEDYGLALKSNKLIILYFYASWCPICRKETEEALYPFFNELTGDEVIGFRVNFNDSDTDNIEKNLAREYGITYQHSKVFILNNNIVLKSLESWSKERYKFEVGRFK